MKNLAVPMLLIWSLFVVSCDTREDVSNTHPAVARYKTVGHQIPTEVGMRWIDLYNQKNLTQNRIGLSAYSIDDNLLSDLRESVPNLTGVAFHYGIDATGSLHIIAIPVNESLRLWTEIAGRIYVDANTSTIITKAVAEEWADNFKEANPDAIWFHYFGQNVVTDILASSSLARVDIIPALSDLDFSPQLLLIVTTSFDLLDLLNLGRTNGETPIYDASYPCPRCEVQ
jgi:hypothetical protein